MNEGSNGMVESIFHPCWLHHAKFIRAICFPCPTINRNTEENTTTTLKKDSGRMKVALLYASNLLHILMMMMIVIVFIYFVVIKHTFPSSFLDS